MTPLAEISMVLWTERLPGEAPKLRPGAQGQLGEVCSALDRNVVGQSLCLCLLGRCDATCHGP